MMPNGQFSLNQLVEQARATNERLAEVRAQLSATEVAGVSTDGTITVRVNVLGDFQSVEIAQQIIDTGSRPRIEAQMLSALHDAGAQLRRAMEQRLGSVTATEQVIARRLTEGQSNPEIAAGLFLSRRTVETHVSHILAKLDLNTRSDVAREAARHLSDTA